MGGTNRTSSREMGCWPHRRRGLIAARSPDREEEEQVAESAGPSYSPRSKIGEFSSVMKGFDVIDRNGERIGRVRDVSIGRTCASVETGRGSLFGRKERHGVHVWVVREVDLDGFTISLAVSMEDVSEAPEFRELDPECETTLARHYYDRLTALGESVDAETETD